MFCLHSYEFEHSRGGNLTLAIEGNSVTFTHHSTGMVQQFSRADAEKLHDGLSFLLGRTSAWSTRITELVGQVETLSAANAELTGKLNRAQNDFEEAMRAVGKLHAAFGGKNMRLTLEFAETLMNAVGKNV